MNSKKTEEFCSLNGITLLKDEPLSRHCSFKIGGTADYFALPDTMEKLIELISFCREDDIRYFLLGRGTNLLFDDNGFRGVIISLTELDDIDREGDEIIALCGTPLSKVCLFSANNGLTGMEMLFGIPGSVGGGVYMNAGAYGREMKDVVLSVDVLDKNGDIWTFSNDECDFSYRHSAFCDSEYVVLSVRFGLSSGDKDLIRAEMDNTMSKRIEKQPLDLPSAGSAFKRPENNYASRLIDDCGLKGLTVGGAQVSTKHAGFIVNIGNATCQDVKNLSNLVIKTVYEKTGITLSPEPEYVEAENKVE